MVYVAVGFVGMLPEGILSAHDAFVPRNVAKLAGTVLRVGLTFGLLTWRPTLSVLAFIQLACLAFDFVLCAALILHRYPGTRVRLADFEWGLVRKVHQRGDRREYYESLNDVWEMFTLVLAQRKRREVDPILTTLRRCKEELSPETLGAQAETDAARERSQRVRDLLTFLTLMDGLAQRFFETHRGLRQAVELLAQTNG